VSGFLSLKEARKGPKGETPLSAGQVVNASVLKMSENGRTVTLSVDSAVIKSTSVSEVSSVSSVLPGALVSCLVTAVLAWGLNVQLLGFFGGTLDLFHLPPADIEENFKVGQKIKARVLWDVSSNSPKTFALSALPHVVHMMAGPIVNEEKKQAVRDAFPVGTVLDAIKVRRVESEWGLVCEGPNGVQGFAHVCAICSASLHAW
jgi:rRNA biogenesis protein RRP5